MLDIIKAIIFGVVEGVTEWLPISSTGHMILLDQLVHLDVSPEFKEMFLVVIQLGAILSVVVLYWDQIFPFCREQKWGIDSNKMTLWFKLLVASVPAGVIGVLWDDLFQELFYNYITVAVMLILFGVIFIIVERYNRRKLAKITEVSGINYYHAITIGVFQLIAAVFPGTSRSGATIIGALLLGISRTAAAEFTFFLAIPAMFGGSAIKLLKYGLHFTPYEFIILLTGMLVAYLVSMAAIKFLLHYIKRKDFTLFGWYRIILGIIVLLYFYVVPQI